MLGPLEAVDTGCGAGDTAWSARATPYPIAAVSTHIATASALIGHNRE